MFRKRLFFLACSPVSLLLAPRSFAHPMGNFSVNHYSKISLESDGVRISYIIDLAEIPTYQELQQGNVTADVADPAVTRFVGQRGAELGRGLSLLVDGKRLPLRLVSSQVIFPPGAGGLPTMKMGFVYQRGLSARSQIGQPAVCRRQFSRSCRMERNCRRRQSGGQFHQQLGAADRPQRRVDQLSHRPAQQPAAAIVRSHSIPLSDCARDSAREFGKSCSCSHPEC